MKKYAVLLTVTALILGGLFAVRSWTREQPIAVKTVTVQPQTVLQTVECTGRVELAESREVFVELPCVAGDVLVTVGQQVKAGDVLFEVDADATQAVLSQFGSAVPDGFSAPSTAVTAPIDGSVTQLNVQTGQMTDHTTPCAVIAPGTEVCITVAVREKHLREVKIGQRVEVSGVGFDRDRYSGTLTALADSAHQQYIGSISETVVDAVVTLDEGQSDASLRVGLGAVAQVQVSAPTELLLVPYECIAQNEEGEEYVYIVTDDGTARRQVIESTADYANGALVVSGISAGERLVCEPDTLSGERVLISGGD